MRVLITGAAGFIGGFLASNCLERGDTVLGVDRHSPGAGWPAVPFDLCDVCDGDRVAELVASFRPHRIYHLAAQSFPTVSLVSPRETMQVNVAGTINIFEAVRALEEKPVVVVACSSAEYGPVAADDLPVRETHALQPLHPYGVSKVAQDLLAAQYFTNYQIPALRIRIFNTTGPGKTGDVCSDLTRRAVEIECGLRPPILRVGNLETRRAIADVRDLALGLMIAPERCLAGDVYNLGGDRIYSVQEIIAEIRRSTETRFIVEQDPALMRPCDEPVIAGDTSKFRKLTGWSPSISLPKTIADMLAWWRERLKSERNIECLVEAV